MSTQKEGRTKTAEAKPKREKKKAKEAAVSQPAAEKPKAAQKATGGCEAIASERPLPVGQAVVNIGMIGHVDHGKTSLTEKLSGKWTDTHSEEIKRGISIRLGYADSVFRRCPKCRAFGITEKCAECGSETVPERKVSFVDAPGHETLMATMLSGAALMHGAVLVVAANEPFPQPRTVEHLMAIKMSGIKHVVVAQNKIDLVEKEKALEQQREIRKFLTEMGYGNAPIIPTSASFGANIGLLIQAIEEEIPTPQFDRAKPLKMFVARSFDANRPGISPEKLKGGIIGGTITQGIARIGDEIEIKPGLDDKAIQTRIVSIGTENEIIQEALPGGLIAIQTELDSNLTKNDQMRGQVAGIKGSLGEPTTKLLLELHEFKRLAMQNSAISVSETIMLTIGTMSLLGTVLRAKGNDLQLNLRSAVVIEKGQTVAISKRDGTHWRLVAYGIQK
ncbi:MAG: translation initiation factor IF-2 subunit gamma [archaeon]